ncbi:hypothetical protein [Duganella vulcania]|uniref:Uncharacterized protein n=1 Tax=Duganella vulcania TaxID=2692166 RepID=A0A845GGJ7_9BURK|nr:hypothetical protein [Duganella vulcania]MYM92515.1 hypothetical protein [Duganella vulcania]
MQDARQLEAGRPAKYAAIHISIRDIACAPALGQTAAVMEAMSKQLCEDGMPPPVQSYGLLANVDVQLAPQVA